MIDFKQMHTQFNYQLVLKNNFTGIIDLVEMNADIYKDDDGTEFEVTEIPEEYREKAEEYREKLLEAVAEAR